MQHGMERIRVTQLGQDLGEFSVIRIELFEAVNAVKQSSETMSMHRLTPESSIEEHLASEIAIRKQKLIRHLNIIGNECVNQARRLGSYHDQTRNLRSSIGYIVTVDGNITHISSFEVVKQRTEGASKGREFARSLAVDSRTGRANPFKIKQGLFC